jgi:hypothetical protein
VSICVCRVVHVRVRVCESAFLCPHSMCVNVFAVSSNALRDTVRVVNQRATGEGTLTEEAGKSTDVKQY